MSASTSTDNTKISIKILAGNIRGGHKEARLEYGLKKAYKNAGEPDVVLASETWSDDTFCIDNKFSNYSNGEEAQIGTGMLAAIDKSIQHKVKNHSNRLQLIQLMHLVNIIHLYAPQVGKDYSEKENFASDIKDLVQEITNDRPILMVGDFNIDKKLINESYLKENAEKGQIISTDLPTQSFGHELDYAICFNKNNELSFDTTASLIEIPTSDHDAILFEIQANNTKINNKPNIEMETVEKREILPIPKTSHQKLKFKTVFTKKWNTFLYNNSKVASLLDQQSNLICTCKKGNHQELIDSAYKNLKDCIITAVAAAVPAKKSKNSCFLRFFNLAKNEIYVFRGFLSLQKMKFMFFEVF